MKSLIDLLNDINMKRNALKKLNEDAPRLIGTECVKIIKQNFNLQGYDSGNGVAKWQKRSKATDTAYEYNRTASYKTPVLGKKSKYKNPYKGSVVHASRPILFQTGNLRDSIRYEVSGKVVTIGVFPKVFNINGKTRDAIAYAKINNEGGSSKWGRKGHEHDTHIPKRQFMPKENEPPNLKMLKASEKQVDNFIRDSFKDWQK